MIQDRSGSLLHSLVVPFRKTRKLERNESDSQDPSVLESRRKLEQRIEMALGDTEPASDHA